MNLKERVSLHYYLRQKFKKVRCDFCQKIPKKRKIDRLNFALKKGYNYALIRKHFYVLCSECHHAYDNGKSVFKLHPKTNKILKIYPSIKKAARENKITPRAIRLVCQGKNKMAKNFKWKFVKSWGELIRSMVHR